LAELLAMRSHGIHGGRHGAGAVGNFSAAFVPGHARKGCGAIGAARASRQQDQDEASSQDPHRSPRSTVAPAIEFSGPGPYSFAQPGSAGLPASMAFSARSALIAPARVLPAFLPGLYMAKPRAPPINAEG